MKILVIDGQGGKMGAALTEQILKSVPQTELVAVGTNSMATAAMLRAGATAAATGENPVIVNSAWADVIVGPIGSLRRTRCSAKSRRKWRRPSRRAARKRC